MSPIVLTFLTLAGLASISYLIMYLAEVMTYGSSVEELDPKVKKRIRSFVDSEAIELNRYDSKIFSQTYEELRERKYLDEEIEFIAKVDCFLPFYPSFYYVQYGLFNLIKIPRGSDLEETIKQRHKELLSS